VPHEFTQSETKNLRYNGEKLFRTRSLELYFYFMNPSITLSIVFLNFNKLAESQTTCLKLIELCSNRTDIEIIAIDNGSNDGTTEFLQSQKEITFISLADNTGIAGYNAGFQVAQGEFILVLDDDSCPLSLAGVDQALTRLEQHPNIGIIAAHIQNPDGSPQWSWHLPKQSVFAPSPFFIGCGFIIRHQLFAQIGWYPDNFFLYQNEVAVSFEVRLQGFEIFYDSDFIVIHRGIPSQRPNWRRIFFPTRNTLWLIRHYYPQPLASYMIFSRLVIGLIRALSMHEFGAFLKAAYAGLIQTVPYTTLSPKLRKVFKPFERQNSVFHQMVKRT